MNSGRFGRFEPYEKQIDYDEDEGNPQCRGANEWQAAGVPLVLKGLRAENVTCGVLFAENAPIYSSGVELDYRPDWIARPPGKQPRGEPVLS